MLSLPLRLIIVVGAFGSLVTAFYVQFWSQMSPERREEWSSKGRSFWSVLAGGGDKGSGHLHKPIVYHLEDGRKMEHIPQAHARPSRQ